MGPEKILVIQTAFLGDAVLTLPMIQQLKLNYPSSRIEVLTIPSNADVFKHSPDVDDVIIYDKHRKKKSIRRFLDLIWLVHSRGFNSVYSPHRSFRSSLIVLFSGAGNTFGFENASFNVVYKYKVKYNQTVHEVARNLQLAGFNVDEQNWKIQPKLEIHDSDKSKIKEIQESLLDKKIVAVAPGSVWETKIYPRQHYIEIIKYLVANNCYVLLIGSDSDKSLCDSIKKEFASNVFSYAGELSLTESIALIGICSLLICNDSAPTHMAMAAGTPCLTIYCSTIPGFGFYPYSDNSQIISLEGLQCKPCGIHGHKKCPIGTFECGIKLTPDSIIKKINEIID